MFSESNGCNTPVKLENFKNHINQCIFNQNLEVRCDKGCGLKIIKKEYDNNCISHLANLVIHQQKQISVVSKSAPILVPILALIFLSFKYIIFAWNIQWTQLRIDLK